MGAPSKNGPSSGEDGEQRKELRIYEDVSGKKGMMVQGLEEVIVTNSGDVFKLLQKANKHRKVHREARVLTRVLLACDEESAPSDSDVCLASHLCILITFFLSLSLPLSLPCRSPRRT